MSLTVDNRQEIRNIATEVIDEALIQIKAQLKTLLPPPSPEAIQWIQEVIGTSSRLNKKTWLFCNICKVKWLPPEPFIKADYFCPKCNKLVGQALIDLYNKYPFTPYTRKTKRWTTKSKN